MEVCLPIAAIAWTSGFSELSLENGPSPYVGIHEKSSKKIAVTNHKANKGLQLVGFVPPFLPADRWVPPPVCLVNVRGTCDSTRGFIQSGRKADTLKSMHCTVEEEITEIDRRTDKPGFCTRDDTPWP